MLIIGIDPGISGAICFFEEGQVKEIIDMPVMADGKKNKRQINGPQIYNEILNRINKFQKKRYNRCDRTSLCNARPRSH